MERLHLAQARAGRDSKRRLGGVGWKDSPRIQPRSSPARSRPDSTFDDLGGGGPALYVGGLFTNAGGVAANRIVRWNGASWTPLGGGTSGWVEALAVFDDGSGRGPALFASGGFLQALDSGDGYLARWQACDSTPPLLACPAALVVGDPLPSPPGEFVAFSVTASDDFDPAPTVVCVPPSGSFFAEGTTLVQCTATDATGNE